MSADTNVVPLEKAKAKRMRGERERRRARLEYQAFLFEVTAAVRETLEVEIGKLVSRNVRLLEEAMEQPQAFPPNSQARILRLLQP